MPPDRRPVDRSGFAARREVRDILARIVNRGAWTPAEFEQAVLSLARRRRIALRQLLRFLSAGRVADEVAALELLGRLASVQDDPALSRIANDSRAAEGVRVACGLVLLGHDRPDLIEASDVSGLILRWQARFVAEEPSLRRPLVRLYGSASRHERASWILLQDRELAAPEERAAVFEMLLDAESDPDLRSLLLDGLSRTPGPWSRGALRRIEAKNPEERDAITAALAALAAAADPHRPPDGWSAMVGFCDGAGSFPLRFDFRAPQRRPLSALFVLNLETGVREALALCGVEVQRYDELDPGAGDAGEAEASPRLTHPVAPALALALLVDAERVDQIEKRTPPHDFDRARRLLDPLADLQPARPDPLTAPPDSPAAARTAELLDHPGYAGWFYDAGDHALDDLRLELLRAECGDGPKEEMVSRAAERLARSGEPRRLVRMLRHNGLVHRAAGEHEFADLALAAVGAINAGGFVTLPLVRRMARESLHPGHYFLTPVPDAPERLDVAGLLVGERHPSKVRVLAVDLALIFSRAFEVWLSRTPSQDRPHGDQVQQSVLALAQTGARLVIQNGEAIRRPGECGRQAQFKPELRARLRDRYSVVLPRSGFPATKSDPGHERLLDGLVEATEALVVHLCLGPCRQHCPADPRGSGQQALGPRGFPAGAEAEMFIRTWPGVFLHDPSPSERTALAAMLGRRGFASPLAAGRRAVRGPFRCGLCGEDRPASSKARSLLLPHGGGGPLPVCRRCRDLYRRDPAYRAEVIARLGKLL